MNHDTAETATLIGVPLGTLQRWLAKYVFPVGTLNDHNEWTFSDTDVQVLRGMYETAQFGDQIAFVIKKQFRSLLRRRSKASKVSKPRPKADTSPMRKRIREMQERWPEVPIHSLLWVVPEKREEYVQKVREGYLTLSGAAKIVKLSDAHLRQRVTQSAKRFFPKTVFFPLTGNHPAPTPLLHPDDVEKFRQFYARPEGMLSIEHGARYSGLHASTIRNGLREKTLKADAVVDGHIKLFKKETLEAFKEFVRTRVRKTPKRRVDRPSTPVLPPKQVKKPKAAPKKKPPKKIVGWERASKLTGKSVIWLRRRASHLGGTKAGHTWTFDRDRLEAAARNPNLPMDGPTFIDTSPPPAPPPPPVTPRKLMLDGSRLVYMNAYGMVEEANVVLRLRKDRGILIVVDAAGCEVDPELRKTVSEALNNIWWSYDTDGSIVPWLSPE